MHAPVLEVMGFGHHKDLRGFKSASFGTLRSTSLFVICSILQPYAPLTIFLYVYVFLCINTPVCCMYFASLNINLATYFSQLALFCLKLLLGSTPDSPTPSGPPKFEASIKRVAQPTSWSQCLARLQMQHLHPNSKLNTKAEYNDSLTTSLTCWTSEILKHEILFNIFSFLLYAPRFENEVLLCQLSSWPVNVCSSVILARIGCNTSSSVVHHWSEVSTKPVVVSEGHCGIMLRRKRLLNS